MSSFTHESEREGGTLLSSCDDTYFDIRESVRKLTRPLFASRRDSRAERSSIEGTLDSEAFIPPVITPPAIRFGL